MAMIFANRMSGMKASEIREILKVTEKPEIISFAGGLPAPEVFPVERMKEISKMVLHENGREALQYTTTEGFAPLREKISSRMNEKFKTKVIADNILITNGSQQGLDFAGRVFLNEGDVVLCESPTYMGAINAFNAYSPRYIEIPTDDGGMIISELKKVLKSVDNIKLIYVIPDFQNPTGRTWSMSRRKEFMEVVNEYELPVVEDNPYGELRFNGQLMTPLKSMDSKGLVIFLGTFSKTFCPGMRIGWVAAEKNILKEFILVKQGCDLQASTISQREISKYMDIYDFDEDIKKIREIYKNRRNVMIDSMEKEFPEKVHFNRPDGGLFTWIEFPEHVNSRDILSKCMEKQVAFVPGGSFFPNGGKENNCRMNYSNMPEERIIEGIKRMADVLKEFVPLN